MSGPHAIKVNGTRVSIECQNCKMSMDVSSTSVLGAAMIKNWPKLHKCPKAAKK